MTPTNQSDVCVLGISALFHDSAAAVIVGGRLVAAAEEERFSRKKHDGSLPWRAARACLSSAKLCITDIDCVAYYENPASKLDRQFSMIAREPREDIVRRVVGRVDPLRVYRVLREGLGYDGEVRFVPHHVSHAASCFFFSGFQDSAILVLDAVGEWSTSSWGLGSADSGITLYEMDRFPHSLGLFYSAITSYLGFEVTDGEYKTMGLAPMGRPVLVDLLHDLISVDEDGNVLLNLAYFDFNSFDRMWTPALETLLGRPPRGSANTIEDWHADLARSAQTILEEVALRKVRSVQHRSGARHLCMAGGVALNCVMNTRIRRSGTFEDMFVQPAAGDSGAAVGAAAAVSRELGSSPPIQRLENVLLGPEFSTEIDIIPFLKASGLPFSDYRGRFDELLVDVAKRLNAQQVVGWFQGRMEFGPRSLGARSILADPRSPQMRDRINEVVKMREPFRPFAPAVLARLASSYFDCKIPLPFMLETVNVRRDSIPSVTHVDGSARVQTVDRQTNLRFAALLEAFWEETGCPILLNTSFNQRGEPIVCSPEDAAECFIRSELDVLVLQDVLLESKHVPQGWKTRVTDEWEAKANRKRVRGGELAIYQMV